MTSSSYGYLIKYNPQRISFYFTENFNNEFLLNFEIDKEKHLFAQALVKSVLLKNTISHGLPLKQAEVKKLASFIVDSIKTENGIINDLKIKNNKIKAYFFTLAEIKAYNKEIKSLEKKKQIHLWEFTSSNSQITRELWVEKNELELKNCCLRQFLMQEMLKTKYTPQNVANCAKNFCVFPKSFVDINVLIYNYFLYPKEKINTNKTNDEKTGNNTFIKDIFSVKYLYYSSKREKTPTNSLEINTLLNNLNNDSIFNLNCCDLFTQIKEDNSTFFDFIHNCLVTIFLNQAYIVDRRENTRNKSPYWNPALGFNLLCCCISFDQD